MIDANKRQQLTDRIKICCKILGDSGSMSKATGIPKRTIDSYLYSEVEPKWSNLEAIGLAAKVSFDWLIAGVGTIERKSPTDFQKSLDGSTDIQAKFASLPILNNREQTEISDAIASSQENLRFIVCERLWIEQKKLKEEDLIAVLMHGDSMHPTIKNGSSVIVNIRSNIPQDGQIYLLQTCNGLIARRIQIIDGDSVLLISDNKLYTNKSIQFSKEVENIKILGQIIWIGHDI